MFCAENFVSGLTWLRRLGPVLAIAFSVPMPAVAAEPAATGATLSAEDLGRFFDGLLPYGLAEGDIAGGEVVVVRDGSVLFAKGYGVADVKTQRPVSPGETLFRAGSVSKTFTWTAVMQLVEQGKLDLDRNVDDYLDFKIPSAFDQPITLRELMTHTAGFEISAENLIDYDPARLRPLGEVLKSNIPARIFPPGKVVAYSNFGAALAGYIVERVSGEPFADYIARHIFAPLGMSHSSFAQPLPAPLQGQMASGYRTASDAPEKYELIGLAPAGALATTALDMGRFMIAQLDDGSQGSAAILKPETAQTMHALQRSEAPGLNGFALGFYEESRNGTRIIGHGGDTQFFHSDLHLIPDGKIGLYVSFNSQGKDAAVYKLRSALFEEFVDRYFPAPVSVSATTASAVADAETVSGSYISSDRQETSIFRVFTLLGASQITGTPEGILQVSTLTGVDGQPYRWREIGPLRYGQEGGPALLSFVQGADGRIDHAAWSGDPTYVLQPAPAGERAWVLPALGAALAVLVLTTLIWFAGWLTRLRYGASLSLPPAARLLRRLARVAALLWLIDLAGWFGIVMTAQSNIAALSDGLVPVLLGLYGLGLIGLGGSVVTLLAAVWSWRTPARGLPARIGDSILALAACGIGWFVLAFNLVSFATRF